MQSTVCLEKPITHAGTAPADLVGESVLVRPYYHVPTSRSSLESTRSPFTFEGRVVETFGEEMVIVQFTWAADSAPWNMRGAFFPRELHKTAGWFPICKCPACAGDGIHEHRGA
ncbi:hypothetical protein [Streptomyces sp. 1222.5]|uniref:hypothetical protein n=1 Tax=Streptomyces sp. 1222.5 TaxID=1881026 RepID=UPI003EC0A654